MAMECIHMQMVKGMINFLGDGNFARKVFCVKFLPGFIFTSGSTVSNASLSLKNNTLLFEELRCGVICCCLIYGLSKRSNVETCKNNKLQYFPSW